MNYNIKDIEDQIFFERFVEEIKILGWGCDFTEACHIVDAIGYNLNLPKPSDFKHYPYVYTYSGDGEEKKEDTIGYLKDNHVYSYDTRHLVGTYENDTFTDTTGTIQNWLFTE